MTRTSTLCVLSSTLVVLALATNVGASAGEVDAPKVPVPKISIQNPQAKITSTRPPPGPVGQPPRNEPQWGIGSNGKHYRKLPGTNQLNPQPLPP
jgi:hypothetical protein